MAFRNDILRMKAVCAAPKITAQWFREHESAKDAATTSDPVMIATHLARATTADPSFNLYSDEERTVSSHNPLNTAFESMHGKVDPLTHYKDALEEVTGHMVEFNTDKHEFETKGKYFVIDNVLV